MSSSSVTSIIRSLLVALSAASYATAQIPLGLSMVPNPAMQGNNNLAPPNPSSYGSSSGSPDPSYTGYLNPGYGTPAPSYMNPSYSSSSLPVETGSPAYGAPPSQYTPPPSQSSYGYQQMPYSSFTNGGYSQMDCGYGYQKGSDGKCSAESWVRAFLSPSWFSAARLEDRSIGDVEFVLIGLAVL